MRLCRREGLTHKGCGSYTSVSLKAIIIYYKAPKENTCTDWFQNRVCTA